MTKRHLGALKALDLIHKTVQQTRQRTIRRRNRNENAAEIREAFILSSDRHLLPLKGALESSYWENRDEKWKILVLHELIYDFSVEQTICLIYFEAAAFLNQVFVRNSSGAQIWRFKPIINIFLCNIADSDN